MNISINDIETVVKQYGRKTVKDPRRVYAILADLHPHESLCFKDVETYCQQWRHGVRPERNKPFSSRHIASLFSLFKSNALHEVPLESLNATNAPDVLDSRTSSTGSPTTSATPFKPHINTTPIKMQIDTSKSFRR